jgi:hypothetical protein
LRKLQITSFIIGAIDIELYEFAVLQVMSELFASSFSAIFKGGIYFALLSYLV